MKDSTTDPELTVLAAKAAGIRFEAGSEKPHPKSGAWFGLWLIYDHEPGEHARRYWNPLADDGDALRLAVKLQIDVKHYGDHVVAWWENYFGTGQIAYDADPFAATRLAITRAAAEIGRSHHA